MCSPLAPWLVQFCWQTWLSGHPPHTIRFTISKSSETIHLGQPTMLIKHTSERTVWKSTTVSAQIDWIPATEYRVKHRILTKSKPHTFVWPLFSCKQHNHLLGRDRSAVKTASESHWITLFTPESHTPLIPLFFILSSSPFLLCCKICPALHSQIFMKVLWQLTVVLSISFNTLSYKV